MNSLHTYIHEENNKEIRNGRTMDIKAIAIERKK